MNDSPFTSEEQLVMTSLVKAYNDFTLLKSTHPSHNNDFGDAIHTCQRILGQVALRRQYPNYFSKYETERPEPPQLKWVRDGHESD